MDFKAKAASTDKKGWTAFPLNQPLTAPQSTQIQWQCYQSSCYYQKDLSYDVFFSILVFSRSKVECASHAMAHNAHGWRFNEVSGNCKLLDLKNTQYYKVKI